MIFSRRRRPSGRHTPEAGSRGQVRPEPAPEASEQLSVAPPERAGGPYDIAEAPAGLVFDQSPSPGTAIEPGDVITLFISTGP